MRNKNKYIKDYCEHVLKSFFSSEFMLKSLKMLNLNFHQSLKNVVISKTKQVKWYELRYPSVLVGVSHWVRLFGSFHTCLHKVLTKSNFWVFGWSVVTNPMMSLVDSWNRETLWMTLVDQVCFLYFGFRHKHWKYCDIL